MLNLIGECHSLSYDALTAHAAIGKKIANVFEKCVKRCKRVIEHILKCNPSCVIIGTQGGLFLYGVYSKRRMDANN
jgi:hypothetical protein